MEVFKNLRVSPIFVVLLQQHPGPCHGVRSLESSCVVRSGAQCGCLMGGHASVAKVQKIKHLSNMDCKVVLRYVLGGELTWQSKNWSHLGHTLAEAAVSLDGLLELACLSCNSSRIPHLNKKRFQEVRQPIISWMRIGDLEQANPW